MTEEHMKAMLVDPQFLEGDPRQYSREEYIREINRVADEILEMLPSRVQSTDLFDFEQFLNNLNQSAYHHEWPADLQETVREVLGRAAEMNYRLSRFPASLGRDFFISLKSTVPILKMIAVYLAE